MAGPVDDASGDGTDRCTLPGMSDLLKDGQPFLASELATLGLSRHQLRRLLDEHIVRRVLRRVYVSSNVEDSRELRIAALALIMPKDGVLYGCTASWAMGVDTFAPNARFDLVPQCVVPHGSGRSKTQGVRCVEGYLCSGDIVELGPLRSTCPTRLTTDLLRTLRRPYALSAADGMAHAGLVTVSEVMSRLDRLKGYPGIIQARELSVLIDRLTESSGESWQRLRLIDAGFPRPRSQYVVLDHNGRFIARLDHAYPLVRVGSEYDGREYHGHGDDIAADNRKRDYLTRVMGWRLEINCREDILGRDDSFERRIGEYLGRVPELPRQW